MMVELRTDVTVSDGRQVVVLRKGARANYSRVVVRSPGADLWSHRLLHMCSRGTFRAEIVTKVGAAPDWL